MTTANTVKKNMLLAKISEGTQNFDCLGHIVWWSVHKIALTREQFLNALEVAGLPAKYARVHNYRSAMIRALKGMEDESIIKIVEEDGSNVVFQFTAEEKVDDPTNPSLQYNPEVTITVDKEAYVTLENFEQSIAKVTDLKTKEESPRSAEIKKEVAAAFEMEKNLYRSSDITRYIQGIFVDQADIVSLRPQGSIYFVPAAYKDIVDKVTILAANLGIGCQFQSVPIPDVSNARKMVADSFAEEVADTLAKMDAEIKEVQGADKKVTDKWIEHRLSQIKKVKHRIDMYCDVLGDKAAEMNGQFDALAHILQPRELQV